MVAPDLVRLRLHVAQNTLKSVLLDIRSGSLDQLSQVDLRRFAQSVRDNESCLSEGRIAVLAGRPVDYGIVNMVASMVSGYGPAIRPFFEVDEAVQWLGCDSLVSELATRGITA